MSSTSFTVAAQGDSRSGKAAKVAAKSSPGVVHPDVVRTGPLRSDKITDQQLQKLAIVYVRQSTQHQVLEHRESTARQYALADRAVALGWPRQAVQVIDEDQGLSGSSVVGRTGFQRLLAEVSADRVGLILGLEMSRFARSCKDWHTLLELCSIYRTLLADADGLYDPSQYNDRLLLGLKGTMSEAELHILKSRLQQGMWNKAERGAILNHAPLGYVRTPAGDFVIDPDEQVQAVVRLIFDQFTRQGSVGRLLKWLVASRVKLPIRPHKGPNRGTLEWRRPNRVTLLNVLHHPIYAGAYRWGHRSIDPRKKVPGQPASGRTYNAHEDCRVLIRDRFPAYITWDDFERHQAQLTANSAAVFGAPRHGPSILAGLLVCGRCGHRMQVGYTNTQAKKTLRYSCQRDAIDYGEPLCQSLSGAVLDALVSERILQAVSPASLELSLAATEDLERQRRQLDDLWRQRLERSRYEVEQARRQYAAVDPEHRLVARELERRWDESLRADEQLQTEHTRFAQACSIRLSPAELEQIHALSKELPALWHAPTTMPENRQTIARMLLEQIIVTVEGDTDRVDVDLFWAGGFSSRHTLERPVQTYEQMSNFNELTVRINTLRAAQKTLPEIAEILNREGFHPPKRCRRFTKGTLSNFLRERGIRSQTHTPDATVQQFLKVGEWWLADLAKELQMPIATMHRWRRVGWVTARKVDHAKGRWAIYANAAEIQRLRQLRNTPRNWPQPFPLELITPSPAADKSNGPR